MSATFRKPWYAYPYRGAAQTKNSPVYYYQIRDADHNILFTSAIYGKHSGAPIGNQMEEAAKFLLGLVNKEENK